MIGIINFVPAAIMQWCKTLRYRVGRIFINRNNLNVILTSFLFAIWYELVWLRIMGIVAEEIEFSQLLCISLLHLLSMMSSTSLVFWCFYLLYYYIIAPVFSDYFIFCASAALVICTNLAFKIRIKFFFLAFLANL